MTNADDLTLTRRWAAEVTAEQAVGYAALVEGMCEDVADLPDGPTFEMLHGSPERFGPRADGRDPEEDPHGAWITRFELAGKGPGILDGHTVGVKDSIAVAGYPCTLGSELLADFVPSVDATVVTRLLDAGGTVVGKTNMDAFAMGDAGELQDHGVTTNPHDSARLAGGSSSGSAAAVAAGECDVGLGTDQAGSVRNPAAWCGLVGLKPTHGAVPYTAVAGMDTGLDHVGVLTRDVETNARVLAAIAGGDVQGGQRLDPRQPADYAGFDFPPSFERDPETLTVGVLTEGFGWPFLEAEVEAAVEETLSLLAAAGVERTEVSVPVHARTPAVVGVTAALGGARILRDDGLGGGHDGWYWTELAEELGARRRETPSALSPAVLASLRFAVELEGSERRTAYARAKNAVLAARSAYDDALEACDVLALPTSPTRALEPATDWTERVERLAWLPANTGLFNQTGHPAISVPAGRADGLPVGVQFVAPRFQERTLYEVADLVASVRAAA